MGVLIHGCSAMGCGRSRTNYQANRQLYLHFCKHLLAEEMRTGSREMFFSKDWSEFSPVYVLSLTRMMTSGINGRAKLPVVGWVTRRLCLAQFGFNKLLSLPFHFIPPADMHKVHCEINGVLKWLLTMSSYWYVFSWNYSTKYFFLP